MTDAIDAEWKLVSQIPSKDWIDAGKHRPCPVWAPPESWLCQCPVCRLQK